MIRRVRTWLHLSFVLAACGPSESLLVLPAANTSVLLHRARAGQSYAVHLYDAREPVKLETSDEEVYVLLYESSLEELGLREDTVARCGVLRPDQRLRLSLDLDEPRWAELAEVPLDVFEAISPGLHHRCDPCLPLRQTRQMLPTTGRATAVARLESGRVLIAVSPRGLGPLLYVVDDVGAFERVEGCSLPLFDLGPLGGNRFVGGGSLGLAELFIDEAAARCEVIRTATVSDSRPDDPRSPDVEVVSTGGNTDEPVYVLTDDGGFFEYRDGSAIQLDSFELHPRDLFHLIEPLGITAEFADWLSIVRLAPAELLLSVGWDKIYHWKDGRTLRAYRVDIPEGSFELQGYDRISALTDLGADGISAGSVNGDFFSWRPGRSDWTYEFTAPVMDRVGAIRRFGNGTIATIEGGRLVRWHPEAGLCATPIEVTGAGDADGRLLLVRDEQLTVADFFGDAERPTGLLRLQPEP